MEKELNPRQERFLELLESTDFSALNKEEQLLVQEFCTPEEYQLQRQMLREAPFLFETDAEPTPLVIEEAVAVPFWKRPVPLYQALTGIAATIALFFVIWPSQESTSSGTESGPQTAIVDTVYQTRTIHDTVVHYKKTPPTKRQEKTVSTTLKMPEERRLIEGSGKVYVPTPTLSEITTTGRSMKDDPAAVVYLSTTYQYIDR